MTTSTFRRSLSSAPTVSVVRSSRADGDFSAATVSPELLRQRQQALVALPWTTLRHVHGVDVERVEHPGTGNGVAADAAITSCTDAVLSVWVADCAPLVIVGAERELAVAHAGWRGLAAGIVDAVFAAFREPVATVLLGPVIGACCYQFGRREAERVAAGVHTDVRGIVTTDPGGALCLDMTAAVEAACAVHGVTVEPLDGCTGCDVDRFSHRARREPQRHVVAAWQSW